MQITEIPYTSIEPMTKMTDVNVAMLSKNLDAQELMGDEMVKMMEQSVQPNLGQNIDLRV